jgi:hypothetical protein
MEVRLENGLQHQLQRSLHDPVGDGRDTQTAQLAVRLRDRHLPHRIRPEHPLLELLTEPLKQSGRLHRAERSRCDPIGSGRTRTLVRPHPLPRDGEKVRVMNEVVQIIETAAGFIDRPMVQLALHPAYSQLRRLRVGPRSTRIHK